MCLVQAHRVVKLEFTESAANISVELLYHAVPHRLLEGAMEAGKMSGSYKCGYRIEFDPPFFSCLSYRHSGSVANTHMVAVVPGSLTPSDIYGQGTHVINIYTCM